MIQSFGTPRCSSHCRIARARPVTREVHAVVYHMDFGRVDAALDKELAAKGDKLDTDLAAAAEALVAANKDYDATVRAANDKLGVEVGV